MVFKIDLKIFIFVILYFFTKQIKIYSIIMLFAIIHECSHLIAGVLLNMKLKRIQIMPVGLSIEFALKLEDFNKKILKSNMLEIKKIIIALAGPLINIIIIIFTSIINRENELIIYSNFMISTFNLLPIYPLDGGRILKSIFNILIGKKNSEKYMNKISNIFLFIITFIFSILIYSLKNMAILPILIYLWYIVIKQNKVYKMKTQLYQLMEKI